MGTIVRIIRPTESASILPGFGSLDSGTKKGARSRNGIRMGTAIRKMDPHSKWASKNPPTIGPKAAPAENPAAQIAIARRRLLGLVHILRRSDSVEGIRVAPNVCRAARATLK